MSEIYQKKLEAVFRAYTKVVGKVLTAKEMEDLDKELRMVL